MKTLQNGVLDHANLLSGKRRRPSTLCKLKACSKQAGSSLGSGSNTFTVVVHPVGGNNRGMFCTADRPEDVWSMPASLRSARPPKAAGVGEAAIRVVPILVLLVGQRLKNGCVTSADWERLCYSCWTEKRA